MVALEDNSPDIAALVLLSPNFAIRDWRARFISGPLGRLLARLLIGEEYSFHPDSNGHAEFWTTHYPSQAIVALMDLLNHARSVRLGTLKMPILIIYTDQDMVVDTAAMQARFDEIQGPAKLIVDLPEASRHELTGDALAPETVRTGRAKHTEILERQRCLRGRVAPPRSLRPHQAWQAERSGLHGRFRLYRSRRRV